MTVIPLADYDAAMGARLTLSPGQVYICHGRSDYRESTLSFPGGAAWQVKGLVDNLASGGDSASIVTQLTAIVPGREIADMDRLMDRANTGVSRSWAMASTWTRSLPGRGRPRGRRHPPRRWCRRPDGIRFNVESLSENRDDFYGSYGSLFFLGILLSVGFSLAAVLIIYYKQISEGYEDQARFDIMQKVGMTRRDIRSSINSQLLLVFFLPLLLAGLHLVFAFPFVHKLLLLFNLWNTRLLVGTTAASFPWPLRCCTPWCTAPPPPPITTSSATEGTADAPGRISGGVVVRRRGDGGPGGCRRHDRVPHRPSAPEAGAIKNQKRPGRIRSQAECLQRVAANQCDPCGGV